MIHDAPSQERRRTGSERGCGSLVSSKPEHAAGPPVLDREDVPALHTPQSASSRVSSLRGSTGPVAPSSASPPSQLFIINGAHSQSADGELEFRTQS